jgi:hypothetical protein
VDQLWSRHAEKGSKSAYFLANLVRDATRCTDRQFKDAVWSLLFNIAGPDRLARSSHCAAGRVLSNIPAEPFPDVYVPGCLQSARPAVELGYDLGFTANGQPLRGRGVYGIDKQPASGETEPGACQKQVVVAKDTTAAIFTWFCGHGFSYGYALLWWRSDRCCNRSHILVRGEGRNDPFSVLKTFFEEPPDVVIYDFACALEEYASNRDPVWFKNTLFLVDRFHWRNHTA